MILLNSISNKYFINLWFVIWFQDFNYWLIVCLFGQDTSTWPIFKKASKSPKQPHNTLQAAILSFTKQSHFQRNLATMVFPSVLADTKSYTNAGSTWNSCNKPQLFWLMNKFISSDSISCNADPYAHLIPLHQHSSSFIIPQIKFVLDQRFVHFKRTVLLTKIIKTFIAGRLRLQQFR